MVQKLWLHLEAILTIIGLIGTAMVWILINSVTLHYIMHNTTTDSTSFFIIHLAIAASSITGCLYITRELYKKLQFTTTRRTQL